MSTKTPIPTTPEPLVTDAQINDGRAMYKKLRLLSVGEAEAEAGAEGHTQGCVAIVHIYEKDRRANLSRIAELEAQLEALRQPSPSVDMEAMARQWWLKYTGLVDAETGKITIARLEGSVVIVRDVEMLAAFAKYVLGARPSAGEAVTELTDAVVTIFQLGPEDQDNVLRFGMRATDILSKEGEQWQASQPVDAERTGVGEYVVRFGSQQRGEQPNVLMYEDELPNAMTTAEYDEWYKGSSVVDGVRMGPRFPSQPPSVSVDQIMEAYIDHKTKCPVKGYDETWAEYDKRSRDDFRSRLASLLNGQQRG